MVLLMKNEASLVDVGMVRWVSKSIYIYTQQKMCYVNNKGHETGIYWVINIWLEHEMDTLAA